MNPRILKLTPEHLADLRRMRLYHWNSAMRHAKKRDRLYGKNEAACLDHARRSGYHMKFVQALNDFFPVGDTAERDKEKASR